MITAGTVQVKLYAHAQQYVRGMTKATAATSTLQKTVVASSLAIIAAMGAITIAAGKMATEFDKRLREISTLVIGVTENDIRMFSREIRDLANVTGKALDDIGKAKYDIISAGFVDLAASAVLLNTSTRLAVGGVTSVTNAADLLTSALNSWQKSGYEAEQAADELFTTVRLGKTTMDELVHSVGRVFPTARTLGASLADVGAAMATITAGGIKTYEAATYLNQAFTKMGAPSDQAAKAMALHGVEIKRLDNGMFDLLETVRQFQGYDLEMMRKFFPEIRAIKAVLSMANNMEFLERAIRETNNAAGANQEAFEKMGKSWSFQLSKTVMRLKDALIDIGDRIMPRVVSSFDNLTTTLIKNGQGIGDAIAEFTKIIASLIPTITKLITLFMNLTGAIIVFGGALAIAKTAIKIFAALNAVALTLAKSLPLLTAGMSTFTIGFVGLQTAFLSSPLAMITAGILALAGAVYILTRRMKRLREITRPVVEKQLDAYKDIELELSITANIEKLKIDGNNAIQFDAGTLLGFNENTADTGSLMEGYNGASSLFDFMPISTAKTDKFFYILGAHVNEATDGIEIMTKRADEASEEIDNMFKLGTAVISGDLNMHDLWFQMDNLNDVIKQLNITKVTRDFAELFGINFSNFEAAVERLEALGYNIGTMDFTNMDLSSIGIKDVKEFEGILKILNEWGISLSEFREIMEDEITPAVNNFGESLADEFATIGETISRTMANSFSEMLLSGRTAMQELEKYNKGLTNNFRTQAEIQEQAWSNMWNNIITDTVRAVLEMIIKYTLLTAALIALNAISGGMLAGAIGVAGATETPNDFWKFIGSMFSGTKGSGLADAVLGDGIITPQGQVIKTAPDDYIMAMKRPQDFGSDRFGGGGSIGNLVYIERVDAVDGNSFEKLMLKYPQSVARGVGNSINKRNLKLSASGAKY